MSKKFTLVTSSYKPSWVFNSKVIFLGHWCCNLKEKDVLSEMDYIIAHPYGMDYRTRKNDYLKVKEIKSKLLPIVAKNLNKIHGVEYSTRSWDIFFGFWLTRYISLILNRFSTLEQVFNNNSIDQVITTHDSSALIVANSIDFVNITNDEYWNHLIFSRILNTSKKFKNVYYQELPPKSQLVVAKKTIKTMRSLKRLIYTRFIYNPSSVFFKSSSPFILNSGLPFSLSLALRLRLRINPLKPMSEFIDMPNCNIELRQKLDLNSDDECELTKLAYDLFFDLLPICYLEGFKNISYAVTKLKWPVKPEFIYTANSYDSDEVFKLWTVEKVKTGSKYFIGQHGSGFGVVNNHQDTDDCLSVADKFFTWGWSKSKEASDTLFNLKILNKELDYSKNGGLLLVGDSLPASTKTYDTYFSFLKDKEIEKTFITKLSKKIQSSVLIRLHFEFSKSFFHKDSLWNHLNSNISIDYGFSKIEKLISNSRVIVFSYQSTGFLECLSNNIPTILILQGGIEAIDERAKKEYKKLSEDNIFFSDPTLAAEHLTNNWNNISNWWYRDSVQNTINEFCFLYSRKVSAPVKIMTKKLLYTN